MISDGDALSEGFIAQQIAFTGGLTRQICRQQEESSAMEVQSFSAPNRKEHSNAGMGSIG